MAQTNRKSLPSTHLELMSAPYSTSTTVPFSDSTSHRDRVGMEIMIFAGSEDIDVTKLLHLGNGYEGGLRQNMWKQ